MTEGECPRLCWWCEHFYYGNAYNYSEYTQGDFYLSCNKNVWEFNMYSTSQDEFRRLLATAQTCKHFKKEGL